MIQKFNEFNNNKINEASAFSAETKAELAKKLNDINKIIKRMDLGYFIVRETAVRWISLELSNKRYSWRITADTWDYPDMRVKLKFDSIASYGSFELDEDCCKFYESVGKVLSQKKELQEIEKVWEEMDAIIREEEKNLN